MPRRTRWCGTSPVMSRPPRMMLPAVGRSTPVSRLITVVLPAPFGPINACRAPFSIDNETSCAATIPPKRFSSPIVSRTGIGSTPLRRGIAGCRRTRHELLAKPGDRGTRRRRPLLDTLAADEHDHHQREADPELPILRRQARDPILQKFVDHAATQPPIGE